MADSKPLVHALDTLADFTIHQVDDRTLVAPATVLIPLLLPSLGPLVAFTGTFTGKGFNTIFRPDSTTTPTPMPGPIVTTDPADNVLELNLTDETLSFSASLGSVPNRGAKTQADRFLNGVPYLQTVNDVTTGKPIGIHLEPGLWLAIPTSTSPAEPFTVARMASIPHGTTIHAQGVALATTSTKPSIAPVDITPFFGGNPSGTFRFQNQTVTNKTTRRIPQDLTGVPAITQQLLDDPNTLLRNQILHQTITQTTELQISTHPGSPLPRGPLPTLPPVTPSAPGFGGGTSNIAFLQGQALPVPAGGGAATNANAFQMDAVFFIETVVYTVVVPPMAAGTPPITLEPQEKATVPLVPSFVASVPNVPGKHFAGGTVKVSTTQIQYSQKVMLDFSGLTWPHVSVATLVPAAPIPIPESLLPLT